MKRSCISNYVLMLTIIGGTTLAERSKLEPIPWSDGMSHEKGDMDKIKNYTDWPFFSINPFPLTPTGVRGGSVTPTTPKK